MTRNRRIVQLLLLVLTFAGVFVVRGNAERWCPFGGVEAAYTYVGEGNLVCSLGISNFYILGAVLLMTLLLRRAFCGYLCPIGAMSEWLQAGARRVGVKPWQVPYVVDRVLSKLKYLVLGIILYFTWSTAELAFRVADPCYALISRHGEDITVWAYVVAGAVVVASLLIVMPFCRWFCPLAAVLNPFSRAGLSRVKRDSESCVDCGVCSTVCPTGIPVDRVPEVKAARCLSCLRCVESCPSGGDGALSWGPPRALGRSWPQAALISILIICLVGAVAAAYVLPLPSFVRVLDNRGPAPVEPAVVELTIDDLSCRGRASLLVYFLDRDDVFAVPGHLRLEAWPGPNAGRVRIVYDPGQTDDLAIKQAITEPYFDGENWRASPFTIEGYDVLDALGEGDPDADD